MKRTEYTFDQAGVSTGPEDLTQSAQPESAPGAAAEVLQGARTADAGVVAASGTVEWAPEPADISVLRDLVRQMQAGGSESDRAFEAFYKETHKRVYGVVFSILRDDREAAVCVNATYAQVWQSIGSFVHDDRKLTSWLFTIARNKTLDHLRRRKSGWGRVVFSEDIAGEAGKNAAHCDGYEPGSIWSSTSFGPEGPVMHGVLQDAMVDAIKELDQPKRGVTEGYLKGWSIAQIAQHMGIPEGTVKSARYGALRALRKIFEKNNPGLAEDILGRLQK